MDAIFCSATSIKLSVPYLSLAALLAATAPLINTQAAQRLPEYNVDISQSSVSGLSSGAFMAVQFHVAFSNTLVGAGVVAGGPYDCAEGSLSTALNKCMRTVLGTPDASRLFVIAQRLASQEKLDALSNLTDDHVYIFSGTRDETVQQSVVNETKEFYRLAGVSNSDIKYVNNIAAGHALITDDFGASCSTTASPYINDCDHDQAGAILQHIYGSLNAPVTSLTGQFMEFDQHEFFGGGLSHSMANVGYAYVPAACRNGESCKVHITFHGCKQTTKHIGDVFYTHAGYNEWADANNIIVLYPQGDVGPGNPNGCWDWWGYDGPNYGVKTGHQMAAVKRMLDRLAGKDDGDDESCAAYAASNYSHWLADRAHFCHFWLVCADGSNENLGFLFSDSTLYEHPPGVYSTKECGDSE